MACGVQEITLAWTMTAIYIFLMLSVYAVVTLARHGVEKRKKMLKLKKLKNTDPLPL